MKVEKMVLGMGSVNCYIVVNETSGQALIIDPGADAQRIDAYVREQQLEPCAILLTHGHGDHIGAVEEVRRHYQIPVYIHEDEKELLEKEEYNLTGMFGGEFRLEADIYVTDGMNLELAGFPIEVLHTPGHTAGGVSYLFPEAQVLFCGDSLFRRSIGRTDFPTGDTLTLLRSIKGRLFTLPEATTVYPGHMEATTIGEEKRENPFIH